MEISFTHKTVPVYREIARPVKRSQESLESVVPDTSADIGRVISARSAVLLKSKDLTSRGVCVSGELETVLLYITEEESAVSFVPLKKEFSMDFELGEMQADVLTQLRLTLGSTEARVLNPRKVAVTVELIGELACFRQEELRVETLLPEEAAELLHVRTQQDETLELNSVCEKTFALSEQYRFPEGKPVPSRLVSEELSFSVEDTQLVGSRAVVKGTVCLDLCYLSDEVNYPLTARFLSPFSQILDLGAESCEGCTAVVEPTGRYFDLVDTISGEKALDMELHAVLQLVSRGRRSVSCLADVYCNRMPLQRSCQKCTLSFVSEMQRLRLEGEGELEVPEDCEEVLCAFASPSQLSLTENTLSASLCLDLVYRARSGALGAARRLFDLRKGTLPPATRLLAWRLDSPQIRREGEAFRCRAGLELSCQSGAEREITDVAGVTLLEEEAWSPETLPTVTLVWPDTEDLWELAKRYHSSVEGILSLNGTEDGLRPGALLIPREI